MSPDPSAERAAARSSIADAITLRAASDADIDRITEIERDSFGDPWSAASFRALLGDGRVIFLVAERPRAPRLVGYIVAWHVVDEAEIANLAVASDARRAGIGARLLDAAIAAADGRACHTIYLEVRDSNHGARALYRTRGFEEIGRRIRYYRAPVEDALVLRRAR